MDCRVTHSLPLPGTTNAGELPRTELEPTVVIMESLLSKCIREICGNTGIAVPLPAQECAVVGCSPATYDLLYGG